MIKRVFPVICCAALAVSTARASIAPQAPVDDGQATSGEDSSLRSAPAAGDVTDMHEPDAADPAATLAESAIDCDAVSRAVQNARRFLIELEPQIDPVRLRAEYGMKGTKFYVEYLNAWAEIALISSDEERAAIRQMLEPVVARTENDEYHNLATCSDEEFKQDVISYLSACLLHRDFGFDTREYVRHIERIVPRILSPEHLRTRGVDNTMALVYRLGQLGFEGGPELCEIWRRPGSVTRAQLDLTRLDLRSIPGWMRVYDMTHEIFYLTGYGQTPVQCADEAHLDYIRRMHSELIPIYVSHRNLDLLAELVMDLNYLKMTDLPAFASGISFLLENQNEDGSWGDHDMIAANVRAHHEVNPRYLPKVGQYLHTTRVTLAALCYPCQRDDDATQ